MIRHVATYKEPTDFLVATEANMMWQLEKRFPMHRYHGVPGISCACNKCPHMALNTLEKLRDCLVNMSPQIEWQPFFNQSGKSSEEASCNSSNTLNRCCLFFD